MISRYPTDTSPMTSLKAIQLLKAQLIIAYEKKFGEKFVPLNVKTETFVEQDSLRYTITNLSVKYDNDRFYIIPVVWDFMVDKYTGAIYVYYNGIDEFIYLFDPNAQGALAFAG